MIDATPFLQRVLAALQQPNPREALLEVLPSADALRRIPPGVWEHDHILQFLYAAAMPPEDAAAELAMGVVQDIATPRDSQSVVMRRKDAWEPIEAIEFRIDGDALPVAPGRYHVMLDTGRLLWEGTFTDRDLRRGQSALGDPAPVDGSAPRADERASLEIPLLDGALMMLVVPGPQGGAVRFVRGRAEARVLSR